MGRPSAAGAESTSEPRASSPKTSVPPPLLPEDHLAGALAAKTPEERVRHAKAGLATRAPLDRTTQAMLLRQLYMGLFEQRRFRKAYDAAVQALGLRVMSDVLHQDAARAATAMGEHDDAIGHLRLAVRRGPPSRRAFHLWTLGSALYLLGRHAEAIGAFDRASRWGTTDKPLFRAHAALARMAKGETVPGASRLFAQLEAAPCGQGYGRFVLGQLAFELGRPLEAQRHLREFVKRTTKARPGMAIALAGEIAAAEATIRASSA